jgi:hypothetical protein
MSARTSSDPGRHHPLSRFNRWPGIFGLAYGVIAAPVSALLMQLTAYNGVQWACGHKNIAAVHIVPAIYFALAAVALWISWRDWTKVGRIARAETATIADRTRFIAVSGIVLSAFSIVLILAMWLPLMIFDPCQR